MHCMVINVQLYAVLPRSYPASSETGPQLMSNVGCYGWESHLLECSYSSDIHVHNCDVVGVHCIPGRLIACNSIISLL